MSITVTIVTTANRAQRFTQLDDTYIHEMFDTLQRAGQFFSNRTLIIGSEQQTEIFSPSSITRIEIESPQDISSYLPKFGQNKMALIPAGATTPPAEVSETHFASRVDFYFEGGDSVAVWLTGTRPSGNSERFMQLTHLFEQPVLAYTLPTGGIGLINPARMTSALLDGSPGKLPIGSWRLNPV